MKDYFMNGKNYKKVREISGPTSERNLQNLPADRITILRSFQYEGSNSRFRTFHDRDLMILVGKSGPLILALDDAAELSSAIFTVASVMIAAPPTPSV